MTCYRAEHRQLRADSQSEGLGKERGVGSYRATATVVADSRECVVARKVTDLAFVCEMTVRFLKWLCSITGTVDASALWAYLNSLG